MSKMYIGAMKANDTLYRYSEGKLDVLNDEGCAVWSEPGNMIYGPSGPVWETDCLVRTLFIRGARLNLLEIQEPEGTPRSVYLNVIAPAELSATEVRYIDHELDVHRAIAEGRSACILDSDEFEEAIGTYGYDHATIRGCWAAAHVGEAIANDWVFGQASDAALKAFASRLALKKA